MDCLRDLIDQATYATRKPPSKRELAARVRGIGKLFRLYRDNDTVRARMYVDTTLEIPLEKLAMAVRLIVRRHCYPNLPTIADIWSAARQVAGMDRERYDAGRYLPPSRDWPPDGFRHAIHAGELEPISMGAVAIEAGSRTAPRPEIEAGGG